MQNSVPNIVDLFLTHADRYPDKLYAGFLTRGERLEDGITYQQTYDQACRVAALIQDRCKGQERIILAFSPGLHFMVSLLACFISKRAASPIQIPPLRKCAPTQFMRILSVADTNTVLTDNKELAAYFSEHLPMVNVILITDIDLEQYDSAPWTRPLIKNEDIALIQFTSGSTSDPKGVVITHANLVNNESIIATKANMSSDDIIVGWLPHYHDMGLISNILLMAYLGGSYYFMSPLAFVQKPLRWLAAISTYRATASGGPNFAYQQCIDRVNDLSGLDLSSWVYAFNGSEPIRYKTLELFSEKFKPVGFDKKAYYPCYGLAETVVFATGSTRKSGAKPLAISRSAMEQGRVEAADSDKDTHILIACGTPGDDHTVTIVDPSTRKLLDDSYIGEICITGPSVSCGYYRNEESNQKVFSKAGKYYTVCTGDLGFMQDGELYVTGRLKDLIIIRGKNIYPQDIEYLFTQELQAKLKTTVAAFVIEDEDSPQMVIVFEKLRKIVIDDGMRSCLKHTLTEINRQLGIVINTLCWGQSGSVPKTSSGKVRRNFCKSRYLQGEYQIIDLEGDSPIKSIL